MEALSRQEYPAMLERLPPGIAVSKLHDRVKKIGKINAEIADWLQERRKVEDAYATGLRKLAKRPLQDVGGDLGIFDMPWKTIIAATEDIAKSHSNFSDRIEKDIEHPLRTFAATNREMTGMATVQGNLSAMAKELEDAQDRSDRLSRRGGRANPQKVDAVANRLQAANQQWDVQAPFVFESLQALDERRLNHLRDILTQYQTHEADHIERNRKAVETTLKILLEVDTTAEIKGWSQATVAGKAILERNARQLSGSTSAVASIAPPQTASSLGDNQSEHSQPSKNESAESRLKSRFGTMLGRRRQSVHGTFTRGSSPSKSGFQPFGRSSGSRDGRPSPRQSSTNLKESENRLSALAESPLPQNPTETNGNTLHPASFSAGLPKRTSSLLPPGNENVSYNFADLSDVPPPSQSEEGQTDADGFTVPEASNDPISEAQEEAAQAAEQPQFKLDIRKEPILEQDADAEAALSNVANTLRSVQLPSPNRKMGTLRGRRDVRNTVFAPSADSLGVPSEHAVPPSPGTATSRAVTLSSTEQGVLSGSDSMSIRSGHSLTNIAIVKHPEMHQPGLNCSIIETVNASFQGGHLESMKINGEIALSHTPDTSRKFPDKEKIRISKFANLEVIGPNMTFIHPVTTDHPDQFTVDVSSISSKAAVAFTYRVHVPELTTIPPPLLITPAWKLQGDKLGLLLHYSLNPAYSAMPTTLANLVLIAHYNGPRATSCQTKPSGTHLKEKSFVYWRLGDITLGHEAHKAVARFSGSEGAIPEPGWVDARWEIAVGELGSSIGIERFVQAEGLESVGETVKDEMDVEADPFADESVVSMATVGPASPTIEDSRGKWIGIETVKKITSGKYVAKQ